MTTILTTVCSSTVIGLVLSFSAIAAADELELGLFNMNLGEVITPSKIPQSRSEISSSISVLDREFIQRSGIRDVQALLSFVPGFFVAPYEYSADITVAYHGTQRDKYRRIQVLVNGRSVYSAGLARVQWAALPVNIEDIERIEINRGPNAASYGANSFMAVINIITRSPLDTLGADVNSYYDERGNKRFYAQYSDLVGNWSYRASLAQQGVTGFDIDEKGKERHDGYQRQVANLLLKHETDNRTFTMDVGGSLLNPEKELSTAEYKFADEQIARHYFKVDWSQQLSTSHEISGHYFYEKSRADDTRYVALPLSFYRVIFPEGSATDKTVISTYTNDLDESRHDLEFQSTYIVNANLRMVSVVNYRQDAIDSQTYIQGRQVEELLRSSINVEYSPAEQWFFNTGLMWEESKISGTFWSPKFGVTHQLGMNEAIRLNYSQAFRTPDLFDQFARWNIRLASGEQSVVTSALLGEQDERIRSYEIGYFRSLNHLGLSYDLRLYHDELDRLVDSNKKFDPTRNATIDERDTVDLVIRGAEFELDWRTKHDTLLRLTYARQHTESDKETEAGREKVLNTTSPELWSFLVSVPTTERLSLNSRYLFAQRLAVYGENERNDYQNVNFWLSYTLPFGRYNKANLGLGMEQRLDSDGFFLTENRYSDDKFIYAYADVKF